MDFFECPVFFKLAFQAALYSRLIPRAPFNEYQACGLSIHFHLPWAGISWPFRKFKTWIGLNPCLQPWKQHVYKTRIEPFCSVDEKNVRIAPQSFNVIYHFRNRDYTWEKRYFTYSYRSTQVKKPLAGMADIIATPGGWKGYRSTTLGGQSLLSEGRRSSIHSTKARLCLTGIGMCIKNSSLGEGGRGGEVSKSLRGDGHAFNVLK